MAAFEEPAGAAQQQTADTHVDEAADVVGDLPAVPDVVDDLSGGGLEVAQGWPCRRNVGAVPPPRTGRFTGAQVPVAALVAALQRSTQDLREGFGGFEGGQEQGLHEVDVSLQPEPRLRL